MKFLLVLPCPLPPLSPSALWFFPLTLRPLVSSFCLSSTFIHSALLHARHRTKAPGDALIDKAGGVPSSMMGKSVD